MAIVPQLDICLTANVANVLSHRVPFTVGSDKLLCHTAGSLSPADHRKIAPAL